MLLGWRLFGSSSGIYNPLTGEWEVENIGVPPDVEVEQDPALVRKGRDPQLEKAVEVVLEELKKNPPPKLRSPAFPNSAAAISSLFCSPIRRSLVVGRPFGAALGRSTTPTSFAVGVGNAKLGDGLGCADQSDPNR
jgi:hypothetical protein